LCTASSLLPVVFELSKHYKVFLSPTTAKMSPSNGWSAHEEQDYEEIDYTDIEEKYAVYQEDPSVHLRPPCPACPKSSPSD
jgi:hypothetical protein